MRKIGRATFIVLIIIGIIGVSKYNTMADLEGSIFEQWENMEFQFQKRADLVPDIVRVIKEYVQNEQPVIDMVITARDSVNSIKLDPLNLTIEDIKMYYDAQETLGLEIENLLEMINRHQDLKENQKLLELKAELEGAENKIIIERRRFNEKVNQYNEYIFKFPNNLLTSVFNFKKHETLKAY
ncbi:MAG: LemA family protein [Bacteroidota bacterium]